MKNLDKQKGISILGILFLGLIIILALSYFHISIKAVVESPAGQENLNFIEGTSRSLWNDYFAKPASYLWNDIWLNIFWKPFISNLDKSTKT